MIPTHRMVDGVRVPGVVMQAFIHNLSYHLTQICVYADGVIDCWGHTDVDGLRRHLETGWIATELSTDVPASVTHVARWTFAEVTSWVDADEFMGEVLDAIDDLNDRPDSGERCRIAVDAFLAEPSDENREDLRRRYHEIPRHKRRYVLGDMDSKDHPLAVIVTPVGEPLVDHGGRIVTPDDHAYGMRYFRERERWSRNRSDTPTAPTTTTVEIHIRHPVEGLDLLHLSAPAEIERDGLRYPTVETALHALSTHDEEARRRVADAAGEGRRFPRAEDVTPDRDWPTVRLAVATTLLRELYRRDGERADLLLSTGDARLVMYGFTGSFWYANGQNWGGRLLEVVRAELAVNRTRGRR